MNFELIYYAAIRWSVRFPVGGRGSYEAAYEVMSGMTVFFKEKMTRRKEKK